MKNHPAAISRAKAIGTGKTNFHTRLVDKLSIASPEHLCLLRFHATSQGAPDIDGAGIFHQNSFKTVKANMI
jgi:hypothetical protein